MRKSISSSSKRAFTLIEIMIVVAILALIVIIAVPNYLRARKRAQAGQILSDLKQLDNAIQVYLIENNMSNSAVITNADLVNYLKPGSRLATSNGNDIFGNPYLIPADRIPKINPQTYNFLSDVAPYSYWTPHIQ
jgi:prepilin-type N-terminal cleavage/methylation domain-containing protein